MIVLFFLMNPFSSRSSVVDEPRDDYGARFYAAAPTKHFPGRRATFPRLWEKCVMSIFSELSRSPMDTNG